MKKLDRYLISFVMKTGIVSVIVFALIMGCVELFSRIDSILTLKIPFMKVVEYMLLSIPQYLMMVSSLSFLFAVTYFLSMLSANNERIALLSSGISKRRLSLPLIILSLFLTLFSVVLKEAAINPLNARYKEAQETLFGRSGTKDARNIVLNAGNGYIIHARRFIEDEAMIVSPVVIRTEGGVLAARYEAYEAIYEDGCWTLSDVEGYRKGEDGTMLFLEEERLKLSDLTIAPRFFKAGNTDVETMDIRSAYSYLTELKKADIHAWQEKCTDYLRSLFSPLAILVLMTVSATMNYGIKKNVLLFSIIQSLSLAVVYYVGDMVFSIAAHQGSVHPSLSVLLPALVTVSVSGIFEEIGKRI